MRSTAGVVLIAIAAGAILLGAAPSRRELMRTYYRTGELTIVYGAEDEVNRDRLAAAAGALASSRLDGVTLIESSSASPEALRGRAVALVGTPKANRFVAEAARSLPLRWTPDGFRVQSRVYGDPSDSLSLFYPSPFDPDYPLFLVTGNSDGAVVEALGLRRRGDLQVRRGGATLLVGLFEGGFGNERLEARAFEPVTVPDWRSGPLSYFLHDGAKAELPALAERQVSLLSRVEALASAACSLAPTEIHLYRSLEDKGLATESTVAAHWAAGALYAVAGREREASTLLAERALRACVPEVPPRVRRGVALALASARSELDDADRTAARLLTMSDPPALAALDESDSPFLRDALETSFARFLLAERRPSPLAAVAPRLPELEALWSRELAGRKGEDGSEPPFPEPPPGFQHGVTFTHEGFHILNGYLSDRAARSLDRLRELDVDAVAIVPYAFLRDARRVEPLVVPTRPGSETDDDVVAAITAAREKGMMVLLKPQIWLRGSWPGAIDPEGPTETEAFFREYRRWILHYALMAERYEVPLLAIGTELEALTRGNAAAWTSIIRDLRRVYRGKLVYAANWGREVEQVSFWPLLDYIGVDFYYPLSFDPGASDEALRAGFEDAVSRLRRLSERHDKPVLLTEIGYASTRSPWREPHASDRSDTLSLSDQARAYEIALGALARETSWVRGMYWWKWPSDLDVGGEDDPGFTPNGKPAAEVLRRWYGRRLQ